MSPCPRLRRRPCPDGSPQRCLTRRRTRRRNTCRQNTSRHRPLSAGQPRRTGPAMPARGPCCVMAPCPGAVASAVPMPVRSQCRPSAVASPSAVTTASAVTGAIAGSVIRPAGAPLVPEKTHPVNKIYLHYRSYLCITRAQVVPRLKGLAYKRSVPKAVRPGMPLAGRALAPRWMAGRRRARPCRRPENTGAMRMPA